VTLQNVVALSTMSYKVMFLCLVLGGGRQAQVVLFSVSPQIARGIAICISDSMCPQEYASKEKCCTCSLLHALVKA